MTSVLPDDILHLICDELRHRGDFPTLYHCAISSKYLAPLALAALYRLYTESRVQDEDIESKNPGEQDLLIQKWSITWRSIILSTLGKTLYPYYQYVRFLDLRDLQNLFTENKFSGKIQKYFFDGELAPFHKVIKWQTIKGAQRTRLDLEGIVEAAGDAITSKTTMLEELSGQFSSNAFLRWVHQLPRLHRLELYDGNSLALDAVQNAIFTHCPKLEALSIAQWLSPEADHQLATFLSGLPENSLKYLQTISQCGVSTETCLAMNRHGKSLEELRLTFSQDALPAVALLKECTAVERLHLDIPCVEDLEQTQNDVYHGIIEWLCDCRHIKDLSMNEFRPAPSILTPVLLNENLAIERLTVQAKRNLYQMKDHQDFHQALAKQKSLHSLHLEGDGEDVVRDDIDTLVDALCQLKDLRDLRLQGVSDYFNDEAIMRLFASLPALEEVYIGGYNISDAILDTVASLKNLRNITFMAVTSFTLGGLLDFISKLDMGNQGLSLAVDMADPYSKDGLLSDEEQAIVRQTLYEKLGGRFEYVPLRDPDQSDFEGESD